MEEEGRVKWRRRKANPILTCWGGTCGHLKAGTEGRPNRIRLKPVLAKPVWARIRLDAKQGRNQNLNRRGLVGLGGVFLYFDIGF